MIKKQKKMLTQMGTGSQSAYRSIALSPEQYSMNKYAFTES